MDAHQLVHLPSGFLPAVVPIPGTVKQSLRKLSIATVEAPGRICGQALRVAYTGLSETDLTVYRLKIIPLPDRPAITLSGFFVLAEGIFKAYERRCSEE